MADEEYNKKLESLQQYIPFLNNMIAQLKDPRKKNREQQLSKMMSLHAMITDRKKKLKIETLVKCEEVILKLFNKKSQPQKPGQPPTAHLPNTPSSPTPPRDIPLTKPVVIPTEKMEKRESQLNQSPSRPMPKVDIYTSAADSLKSQPNKVQPPVTQLINNGPDMSKPPISIEDLEALQEDAPSVDTDRMSLNELTDLKAKLQKQLSKTDTRNQAEQINTTVRNTTILTKKAVEKEKQEEKKASVKVSPTSPAKPVKVLHLSDSIFGNTLSSIDEKIREVNKHKEKERRSSLGSSGSDKSREQRNSKDEKKSEKDKSKDDKHKDKDKTEKKKESSDKNRDKEKTRDDKSMKEKTKDKSKDISSEKDKEKTKDKEKAKDVSSEKDKEKSKDVSREKDKDKNKSSEKKPKEVKKDEKKSDDKVNKEKSKDSAISKEKLNEIEIDKEVKEKPKEVEINKEKSEDKPKPEPPKPVIEVQQFQRLANKYNPKPRKPIVDLPEVPKSVTDSIENSIRNSPLNIPFLGPSNLQTSPTRNFLNSQPQPPQIIPLLSPTNSTHSNDNEVSNINKIKPLPMPPLPPLVSTMLSNPDTTAMINNVMNQLKGQQAPSLLGAPTFNQQSGFPSNDMPTPMHTNSQAFWGNQPPTPVPPPSQNYQQRSFTPLPGNQFEKPMQKADYYPPGRAATPGPFAHQQTPPLLSPQCDRRSATSRYEQDNLFGSQDRDMRYTRDGDWRRDSNNWRRDSRDYGNRGYREDPRSYRAWDSREYERDYEVNRTNYRDPRLNRYNRGGGGSSNRYDHDTSRSRSTSRENRRDDSFTSPLNSLYTGGDGYNKTGKGYGVQNYKIPKIKKEEPEIINKEDDTETVSKEKQNEEEDNTKTDEESNKVENNEILTNVSSSTECVTAKTDLSKHESTTEAAEITSTNEPPESESHDEPKQSESRDEPKQSEPNQANVLKDFLKTLLENEQTRAAAKSFIENVSDSIDDERLKKMVQTVNAAKENQETKLDVGSIARIRKEARLARLKAKKESLKLKKLALMKKKLKKTETAVPKKEERKEEKKREDSECDNVVVSVGERIKNRRRRSPDKKKKAKHKTELDLLHEDIQDMFIRDGVLTATGKRMCCLLKSDSPTPPVEIPKSTPLSRRTRSTSEKMDAKKIESDKLKATLTNVRVLLPKLPAEKIAEFDEEGHQRYLLRRSKSKSYSEDDVDDDNKKEDDSKKEETCKAEEKEKEKTSPSSSKKVRKRTKSWASGILPKRKKSSREEKTRQESELNKSAELVEPDKEYYSDKPWNAKNNCKLCSYYGMNITKHYRVAHPESEVLSSRLSPKRAEEAIKQSRAVKLDEMTEVKLASTLVHEFKCRFCDNAMFAKPPNFYDHISTHTGEYRHVCSICDWGAANSKAILDHYKKYHGKHKDTKSKQTNTQVYGYICTECNFVQMTKKTVEEHVKIYHLDAREILKINLSTVPPRRRREQKSSEVGTAKVPDKVETNESGTEVQEPPIKKAKIDDKVVESTEPTQSEPAPLEITPPPPQVDEPTPPSTEPPPEQPPPLEKPIKKEKVIDMAAFTCVTDTQQDNEAIEKERLQKMTELNDTVKSSRPRLNYVDQLSSRLEKSPELVPVKTEPIAEQPESPPLQPMLDLQSSKKPTKVIEAPTAGVEVIPKDNTAIQDMIQKLRGLLKEEKTSNEVPLLEGPPPLRPLELLRDEKTVLSAGFLSIIKDSTSIEYACRVPSCLFTTNEREQFLEHWREDHRKINDMYHTTKCRVCSQDISSTIEQSLLTNFFKHVEEEHVLIKTQTLLKPRRLSGDMLSNSSPPPPPEQPEEEKDEQQQEEEKKNEEQQQEEENKEDSDDNPFPFKIADVVSLAGEPEIPTTTSPVVEKPPVKPVIGRVLREVRMTALEKGVSKKTPEAFDRFLKCPRELYKCPQFYCKFATNWLQSYELHVSSHVGLSDDLIPCVYCDMKTPMSQSGIHIDVRHGHCRYSCSQCLYRAIDQRYVLVHMKLKHKNTRDMVISLPPKTGKSMVPAETKDYSPRNACRPFKCGILDCFNPMYLFEKDFTDHLREDHANAVLMCGVAPCTFKCLIADHMLEHYRKHNCCTYQCLICKFTCIEVYTMVEHYATEHPTEEPKVVDRRAAFSPDGAKRYGFDDEAFSKLRPVNQELFERVNASQIKLITTETTKASEKNFRIVPVSFLKKPPNGPAGEKFIALIPTSNVSDTVNLYTTTTSDVISKPAEGPSFVFATVDDPNGKDKDGMEPIEVIDEPTDVATADPLSLDSSSEMAFGEDSDSQDFNETTEKSYGLMGYQLYRCAYCDISFSNSKEFKNHCTFSKLCQTNDSPRPYKCVHCERFFKTPHNLMEHIQYHGSLRFACSLCNKKYPSSFSLRLHMRNKHNITQTITTPLIPNKRNLERDEFILRPKPVEPENSGEAPKQFSPTKTVFSPNEIDQLPKRYIFISEIKCALCSYSTKVRTNLVRHLQIHTMGASPAPNVAPINPVPINSERFFDKMTNLANSSFSGANAGRMGGTSTVKPKAEDAEKDPQVPAFVSARRRYVCRANGCNYLSLEESSLRHHFVTLHEQEKTFPCAHCQIDLQTDIDGFLKHLKLHDRHLYKCPLCSFLHNLKHKVGRHLEDKHSGKIVEVITIRALESETVDEERSANSNGEGPPPPSNIKYTKPWHCGMCKNRYATRNDIINHISNKHNIDRQFKCTLCSYKSDNKDTFEDHFKENHPGHDIDIISVYYKSESGGNTVSNLFDTTPLWQRDRPRVRHIRGILFEDSSPAKTKKTAAIKFSSPTTTVSPTTSSTASNLDLAIDAVAKGLDEASTSRTAPPPINNCDDSIIVIDEDDEPGNDIPEESRLMIDYESPTKQVKEEQSGLLSEDFLKTKYGELSTPIGRSFRCPICNRFRTKRITQFVYHVLSEMKCNRFKCTLCSFKCLTSDSISLHCREKHGESVEGNVENLTVDKNLEFWLQMVIRYQAQIIYSNFPMGKGEENCSSTHKSQCEYCHKWFKNFHILKDHELEHWATHIYTCDHCFSEHETLNELFQHTWMVHPNYECCIKLFGPYVSNIIADLKVPAVQTVSETSLSKKDDLFRCAYCDHFEKTLISLRQHYQEHHENPTNKFRYSAVTNDKIIYRCAYCHQKGFDDTLKEHHDKVHPNLKFDIYQFICLECSLTFATNKTLKAHFNRIHPGKKLVFSVIERDLSSKDQYVCTKCPYRSDSDGLIRTHVRKHVRPVDCGLCGATFIYRTDARSHHQKEHMHNTEHISNNAERLKEYESTVQEILSKKGALKRMFARKSTAAKFVAQQEKKV